MQTAQEVRMKKQGNRHQLPSSTASGLCTIPASVAEAGIIRNQVSTSYSIFANGNFMPSVSLFSTTMRPPSAAAVEQTASNSLSKDKSALASGAASFSNSKY
ncbi:hypothetical protein Nepgr_017998 [Nepenthes gracilis]|uniref:Uncharacterized protein n=1 Tax=Nepenthes gracilis TaxID=150966 RepID=A0AAD3STB6_NEPGR|nr:hypothetical protein Nepgr_017998 [Nepenthes gracilis]